MKLQLTDMQRFQDSQQQVGDFAWPRIRGRQLFISSETIFCSPNGEKPSIMTSSTIFLCLTWRKDWSLQIANNIGLLIVAL